MKLTFNPLQMAIKPFFEQAKREDELFAKQVHEKESRTEKPKSFAECCEYIMGEAYKYAKEHKQGNFGEEGKAMHHCVGGYWDRFTSLILSARDDNGERVETIEVDLKKFVILQSRAARNGTSEKHNDIINLVNKNMKTIRKMAMAS